jgi:DNA-binding transcriptional LysR family regulator
MNVHTLKIFCDVIDTCNFSDTAQKNYVTQSAVSQQIKSLAKQYDDPLFIRRKGRFDLTSAGKILYRHAKEIVHAYLSINNEIMLSKNVVSGQIKVSTIYSIGLHELPALVSDFMKSFSQVNLHIEYNRMNKVMHDVISGAVDIGIVAYPKKDPNIEILPFRKDHLVCIVGKNHPLRLKKELKLSELSSQRFIAFDAETPTGKAINKEFSEKNIIVDTVMSFDNIETIKRAVEIEAGISIVPKITVRNEVAQGILYAVEFSDVYWERPLGIIVRSGREVQTVVKLFIQFLQNAKIE